MCILEEHGYNLQVLVKYLAKLTIHFAQTSILSELFHTVLKIASCIEISLLKLAPFTLLPRPYSYTYNRAWLYSWKHTAGLTISHLISSFCWGFSLICTGGDQRPQQHVLYKSPLLACLGRDDWWLPKVSCLSCYPWSPVREIKLESSTNSPFLSNTSFCQELHQNSLNYLRLENPHWPGWETCSVKWVCTSTLQEKKKILYIYIYFFVVVLFLQKALKLSSTWKGRSLVRMRISVLSCYAHQAGYFSCYAYTKQAFAYKPHSNLTSLLATETAFYLQFQIQCLRHFNQHCIN